MMRGKDLVVRGRVSEKLHYSLTNNVIPLLSENSDAYHPIRISADELHAFPHRKGHVGTGLSCGVDSFDTVLSLLQEDAPYTLDTLTLFNVGSHRSTSGFSDEQSRDLFSARLEASEECARELGLPLLAVDSNVGQYLQEHGVRFTQVHSFCSLSAVLACGSFFSWYCYSSALATDAFDPKKCAKDTSYIDLILCPWLSTEYTEFASYGFTKTRLQKLRSIADKPLVQKHLNVCWKESRNCGECPKCIRTLMELYALGKLDLFKDVFDLDAFYSSLEEHKRLVYKNRGTDRFCEEIVRELERREGGEDRSAPPSWWRRLFGGRRRSETEPNAATPHIGKVHFPDYRNAGDEFNSCLLEFFSAEMERVTNSGIADLLMLGGAISLLQRTDRDINDAPLHVWGTGFLFGDDKDSPLYRPNLIVHALRGRLSKEKLSGLLGKPLPEDLPLADPGLLASFFARPNVEKEYAIGFIPHFRELDADEVKRVLGAHHDMHFIDITRSPRDVIQEIQRCETIVSSSLHGLVFSDSLGVPNVHSRLTELPRGGSFKFRDYYSAFGLADPALTVEDACAITARDIADAYPIERRDVEEKKRQLIESFPKELQGTKRG